MSARPAGTPPPRRAPGLGARNARLLLALTPGLAALAWLDGSSVARQLCLAVPLALLLEAVSLRLRALPLRPYLGEGGAVLNAVLLVAWLPMLAGWRLAASVLVAIVLARQALGGLGRSPLHPAMAGAAFAQLAFAPPPAPAGDFGLLAIAWLLGGLALCALRIVRWQAPLGLLAGAALAGLATGGSLAALAAGPWLLAAFFVASDPATGCEQRRARLPFAAAIGALAVFGAPAGSAQALPFAVLLMNLLAPALDAWLAPRRTAATRVQTA